MDAITLKVSKRSAQQGFIVSSRYLNLCVVGAKLHKLDDAYTAWLASLPVYTRRRGQIIGAVSLLLIVGYYFFFIFIFIVHHSDIIISPFIIPLYVGSLIFRRITGIRVQWTYEVIHYAAMFIWFLHSTTSLSAF